MDKMCPFMNRSCTRYCALANAREYKDAAGLKEWDVTCEIENISMSLAGIADALQSIVLDDQEEGES